MKKFLLFIFVIVVVAAIVAAWIFMGSGTAFDKEKETLYIRSNASTKKAVLDSLKANHIIGNETAFEFLAERMGYWKNIKPGKYEIEKGMSLLNILRKLRNGTQTPVNLVITKLRTKEDFARLVGNKFECDSTQMLAFLNSKDSLQNFQTTPETSMWNILPDTYTYNWNSSPSQVYQKIYNTSKKFWTDERKTKASSLGLAPVEIYILASIIEEETTFHKEKDTIASVYLNRLKAGMPLGADPTLKFAAKDFGLKRIAGEILNIESPYNTYRNKGLPPGPICTPSRISIDAVLNPANTPFYYFVARPGLNGHLFSENFDEHLRKSADYHAADRLRREKENATN